jgi:transposase
MGKEEIAEPATQPDVEHHLQRRASTAEEADEEILAEFGYKQELRRDWGLMHNFGISFSIIVCSTLSAFVVTSSMGGRGREMCRRC